MRKTRDRFSSIDDISSSDMILDKTDHVDGFCYKKKLGQKENILCPNLCVVMRKNYGKL